MDQQIHRFPEINDTILWNQFRGGSEVAYTQLLKKYYKSLFNYGFRINQNEDFLKDCIQDVFLELWSRKERINPTESVKWYLFKAIRLRIFREQSNWDKHDEVNDEYHFLVEFNVESKLILDHETLEKAAKIRNILDLLPSRQREIMYLRFYENLDFDEISQIMGMTKQSLYNLLQRAYKSFRTEWLTLIPFLITVFEVVKLNYLIDNQ
jgi:RNA polymerase sigma factor (sigma-70 family)